ncbi:MAG: hypothetical protein Q8O26_07445 [Phreatobacter sp.]|uniref:hypothetical protein n=1 Tax=Phreatobacter sp. TaxID=1966341 RepID=UPI0027341AF2|nr:hypothetical protein [Phreatobacter sp.]MDP2801703.1 hypothetical protein [Phreatobacter sp.]
MRSPHVTIASARATSADAHTLGLIASSLVAATVIAFLAMVITAWPARAGGSAGTPALLALASQDTGRCEADLVLTEIRLRQTTERLAATQSAPVPQRCTVFRSHVEVMRRASLVFGRCTHGRHRQENIGQMEGSIVDWNEIIARNCR